MIRDEMVLVRFEDIEAFAEAREVGRLVKDAVAAAPRGASRAVLDDLDNTALSIRALVADALRAPDAPHEVKRLREAALCVASLRCTAWDGLEEGALSAPMFDELMTATSRCLREVERLELAARRRAREHVDASW